MHDMIPQPEVLRHKIKRRQHTEEQKPERMPVFLKPRLHHPPSFAWDSIAHRSAFV